MRRVIPMPFPVRRRNSILFALLGLAILLAALAFLVFMSNSAHPAAVPLGQCLQSPDTIDPVVPWRFNRDPDDVGQEQGWFDPTFDDSKWEASTPGEAWQPEYVGVAWYRATYGAPSEWGTAYIGVGSVDDTAQLWVNGVKLDWDPSTGDASQIIPLPAGQALQLSIRVVNLGGPGGIKQPVIVGRNPWSALPPSAYARWLAATHPDWPMPGWARNDYSAWTFTGLPAQEYKALFGADGSIAPWPGAANVALWVYDSAAGKIAAPRPKFSLLGDSLPIPRSEAIAAGLTVSTTLFRDADGKSTHWLATITNATEQPIDDKLLAMVRPLALNPDWRPTASAGFDDRGQLWLNGQPFMRASVQPAQTGVATMTEVLDDALAGQLPSGQVLPCSPTGEAAAGAAFKIELRPGESTTLSLDFPAEEGLPFPPNRAAETADATRSIWQTAIGNPTLTIPDATIMNAYETSVGYLLLALTPEGPRPGPLEHSKVWVRDAAFIGEALLGAGQAQRVLDYLPHLLENQAADGFIPAIIAKDGPSSVQEWDAQGEIIFLVADAYRYTHDRTLLQRWEPNLKRAAEYLRSLRARTDSDPPASRGLLPPSVSAEDLGSDEWHHYWDDYWGFVGLEEASFIESELGHTEDASWMQAEATALQEAIRSSVKSVMGADPAFIPAAPEDLTSSAMARGNAVSLYPLAMFPWNDPLVKRSFDTYYSKWLAPNGGGYTHVWGQFWPYGGMGLARDYLRIGQQDRVHEILGWTLSHQTLPGTYAWAEQVSPSHGGITGGDMPHAWAAATYVTLIRELLVMRSDEQLVLFAGVPPSWLEKGKQVGLKDAPTEFGRLTALVESDLDASGANWSGTLTLTIRGSAHPPGGFVWNLPRAPTRVDGPDGTRMRDGSLEIPGAGGTVRIRY